MPWQIQMFPEGFQLLNKELATGLHPQLEKILQEQAAGADDWEIRLAQIATYCGILLDGVYDAMELDNLCRILIGRLEVLREIPKAQIILPLH